MADDPSAIDLGVLPREEADSDRRPDWWPSWRRRWSNWRRRRGTQVRRWAQWLLVLAVSLPLAASASPAPPALAPVWADVSLTLSGAGPAPRPVADGPRLYEVSPRGAGPVLAARRLDDGHPVWRSRLAVSGEVVDLQVTAGVPVLVSDAPHTTAYDPATGRPLWDRPGAPHMSVDGVLLVSARATDGDDRVVTAVEVDSGDTAGSVTMPVGQSRAAWRGSDGAVHLVTLDRGGVMSRHRLSGGPVAAPPEVTARTPHDRSGEGPGEMSMSVRGGLVLVTDRSGPERAVTAYDVVTLRRAWTVPHAYATAACGPVTCVLTDHPDEPYAALHGIDPRTGASRWSATCADVGVAGAPCRLRAVELADGGRLWMEAVAPDRYTGGSRVRSWIVDARSGEPLSRPAGWGLGQRLDGTGLLLTRSDRDRAPERPGGPFHLWWARADGDTDEVEVLGAVDATACVPHHPYLVCWTDSEGVTVWRIRR